MKRRCFYKENEMIVYLVGLVDQNNEWKWSVCGIYSKEDDAITRCTTIKHFIAPIELDKWVPDTLIEWPGAHYPLTRVIPLVTQ